MLGTVIQTQLNMQEVQSINVSSKPWFIAEIYGCVGDCLLQNNGPSSYHVGNEFFARKFAWPICSLLILTVSND